VTARYTVTYAPRAQRDLRKLPEKIATACVEFICAVLVEYRVSLPDHQVLIEVVTITRCADSCRPR
jgi:mRNA-degrading endonuclease RelE of RelBE toxin-antitoxin system